MADINPQQTAWGSFFFFLTVMVFIGFYWNFATLYLLYMPLMNITSFFQKNQFLTMLWGNICRWPPPPRIAKFKIAQYPTYYTFLESLGPGEYSGIFFFIFPKENTQKSKKPKFQISTETSWDLTHCHVFPSQLILELQNTSKPTRTHSWHPHDSKKV